MTNEQLLQLNTAQLQLRHLVGCLDAIAAGEGKTTVTPPALPDPATLEGAALWRQVQIEVGSHTCTYSCIASEQIAPWPWRDLGELEYVMREKWKARRYEATDTSGWRIGWVNEATCASVYKCVCSTIVDYPSIFARLAIEFVRSANREKKND